MVIFPPLVTVPAQWFAPSRDWAPCHDRVAEGKPRATHRGARLPLEKIGHETFGPRSVCRIIRKLIAHQLFFKTGFGRENQAEGNP